MYLLFAGTMFVSAALLFCVQPMVAKMILPLLGGSPAVWNTCMVFFQAVLLAGYVYAHATTAYLGVRWQLLLHVVLLWMPLLVLPIGISAGAVESVPSEDNPIAWLVVVLLTSVGVPFFVVSTSAPLLQKWFAGTGHPAAHDPYFLYSASNLGSMLALLSYPLLLEPNLRLAEQSWLWTIGYVALVLLTTACAAVLWFSPALAPSQQAEMPSDRIVSPLTAARRMRWVALAFVPSSLMLGVTMYITTDIAAIPLLWVIPLALYLLSFILVFAGRPILPHPWMAGAMPIAALVGVLLFLLGGAHTDWRAVPLHLLAFFVVAMFCHGELARDRPPPERLTEFYLWLSVGGVLGGLFNTLAAPFLFRQISVVEYPLVLVLGCLLRPGVESGRRRPWDRALDFALPLAVGVLAVVIYHSWQPPALVGVPLLGALALVRYLGAQRPLRFALSMGALFLGIVSLQLGSNTVYIDRNFFGVVRVLDLPADRQRQLVHGSTMHGVQSLDPARSRHPLSYFHWSGPIGQVFNELNSRPPDRRRHVAIIGLGVGALAAYALPDQDWTYYEIDPVMKYVAQDAGYFTFLRDCRTSRPPEIILGDVRLRLRKAPDHHYDLIVLDAFSSDSIPVHLVTAEALQLYLDKLAPGGILACNISNRYLDLKPVLADLARNADPTELVCYARDDLLEEKDGQTLPVVAATAVSLGSSPPTIAPYSILAGLTIRDVDGKAPSQWVGIARSQTDLGAVARDSRWQRLPGRRGVRVWTDDFSNILSVFKWR